MAGVACNLLLGNLNAEGGLRILPHLKPVISGGSAQGELLDNDLAAWVHGLDEGKPAPGACIFYEANPDYALPGGVGPIFDKVPFTVAFTSFRDETAEQCDLVLPAAMGLERWDDAETPYGVGNLIYSLAVPVADPLFEARPAGEVLLEAGRDLGLAMSAGGMVDVLKARAAQLGADWTDLANGLPLVRRDVIRPGQIALRPDILAAAAKASAASAGTGGTGGAGVCLAPVVRHGVGTPETGIPPYAVKLVGPRDVRDDTSMLHMNAATAAALGVSDGNAVTVTGSGGSCPARVFVDEGLCTGNVAMLYGMGHTAFDAFSRKKGSNLLQLAAPAGEAGTDLSAWSAITVKVAKV
jgi:anaerobic selenocysteine-containing dehydrogenase